MYLFEIRLLREPSFFTSGNLPMCKPFPRPLAKRAFEMRAPLWDNHINRRI